MKIKFRSMLIVLSLAMMSGCVAYAPYPEYSGGYGYSYAAPVVPVPMYYGGGRRHHGHHGHHHRHH